MQRLPRTPIPTPRPTPAPAHLPRPRGTCGRRRAGGLATLATVLGLLALAAWAAAASQRAATSDLRAAAHHLRAAEAFEAAQGGLDFALGLLHAGPLDAACQPAGAPARSLAEWLDLGAVTLACQWLEGGWACQCPLPGGGAAAVPPAPGPASGPASGPVQGAPGFRVEATRAATGGAVQLRATGWGAGGAGLATLSTHAIPHASGCAPAWRRVPGSWRDF